MLEPWLQLMVLYRIHAMSGTTWRRPHLVPSGMRGAVAQEDAHEDDRDKRERLQQFQTQFKQR